MFLQGYILLAYALSYIAAQPREKSRFKQLNATELRELDHSQGPALLEVAACTDVCAVINITESSQGGVVQDGAHVVMDCYPWLSKFPYGTIQWYVYDYIDLDHTMLGTRQKQNREHLNFVPYGLRGITGERDRYYNVTRVSIIRDRGVYECEVCSTKDKHGQVCHSANVTLLVAGREPLLNYSTSGDVPDRKNDFEEDYRVGATVCVDIHPTNGELNRPKGNVKLQCPVPKQDFDTNIPPRIPAPKRTWTHTSRDGRTASFSTETVGTEPELTDEFTSIFPLLEPLTSLNIFYISTSPLDDGGALIFGVFNITRDVDDPQYQILNETFGTWTCTVSNALGTEIATTFIGDTCENVSMPIPTTPNLVCPAPTSAVTEDVGICYGIILNTTTTISPTPTSSLPTNVEPTDETTFIISDIHVPTSSIPTLSSSLFPSLSISPTPTPALSSVTTSSDDVITPSPSIPSPFPTTPASILVLPNTTEPSPQITSTRATAFIDVSTSSTHSPLTSLSSLQTSKILDESTTDFVATHTSLSSSPLLTPSASLHFPVSPTPTPSLSKDIEPPDETTFIISDTHFPTSSIQTLSSSLFSFLSISSTPTPALPSVTRSSDDVITPSPSLPSPFPTTLAPTSMSPNATEFSTQITSTRATASIDVSTIDFVTTHTSLSSPSLPTPSPSLRSPTPTPAQPTASEPSDKSSSHYNTVHISIWLYVVISVAVHV